MAIRYATRSDVDRAVELIKESHAAAEFEFPFVEGYARALFFRHVGNSDAACILLELRGTVQGILMVTHGEHPFGAGRIASETLWYIAPKGRGGSAFKMLTMYEEWAKLHKCAMVSMASLVSNDVSAIYERLNYKPMEIHFTKAL